MPNLATALKEEIQRLSRKEVKAATATTKRSSALYRKDIAELKRQMRDLKKEVTYLRKQEQKRLGRPATEAAAGTVRFSPSWVEAHRERIELSAADYGELVGVSAQTIYNWEAGKTKPQQQQLVAWAAIRGLGKREAWRRLEVGEE